MVQNQIEDYYQIMFSSNYFLFLLKTLQVTLFAWASRPNPLVYASNCHTTNASDPRPRLGPAKLFGGIWSCIDDIEFEWVTADSVLATACWKGVKWRASTWARRPLPAESQRRVTLELEEEEEASDIHLGQKGQFQNIRNEWVKHLASFSSKSCHQNRNGSTLHPFPHPLKPLSLCVRHTLMLPRYRSCFQSVTLYSCMLETCPCKDIPLTIAALGSTEGMKGALCAASCSMANWLLFPLIKCTVYLIFHSISEPLKPRGLS